MAQFLGDASRPLIPIENGHLLPHPPVPLQGDSKGYFLFAFCFPFSFIFLSAQYFFILSDITLRSLADSLRLLRLRASCSCRGDLWVLSEWCGTPIKGAKNTIPQ